MKPVASVGFVAAGDVVDRMPVDMHVPGRYARAFLWNALAPDCMVQAANDGEAT